MTAAVARGLQTSRSTLAHWRPIVSQQIARELPTHSGLIFYGNRPPFTVHWRSRHTHAELAAKTRLPPRPPSSEEIEFLTSVLEGGLLDGREPPRPPGTDVDAICRDLEESW